MIGPLKREYPENMTESEEREDIKDISFDRFVSWLQRQGIQPYRGKQVLKWVYGRQEDDFENMTDLSQELRSQLAKRFEIGRLALQEIETAKDGSKKFLLKLRDGNHIESVLMPERDRNTLCISSQVGCSLGCRFCLTGKEGLVRNLTTGEIVAQVRDIARETNDSPVAPRRISNIVFMGMGEPLANYRNVIQALATLTDGDTGFGFSSRRITVSTSGVTPKLLDFSRETTVNLAVSLNAADDHTRSRLMPINRKYPIQELLDTCRQYRLSPGRKITFEYVLIKDLNDSVEDANRLAELLRSIRCKINLIPFNTFEGCSFRRPEASTTEKFKHILEKRNYTVIVRNSRGQDISAACGQLRGKIVSEPVSPEHRTQNTER